MNQKYINIILAALTVVAIGVAIFGGDTKTITERIVEKTLAGVTGVDVLELDNLVFESPSTTGNERLVTGGASITIPIGSNQVRWNNDTRREVFADMGQLIFPVGETASSSE